MWLFFNLFTGYCDLLNISKCKSTSLLQSYHTWSVALRLSTQPGNIGHLVDEVNRQIY